LCEFDKLKFLVDECTGIGVSKKLKEMKFDCISVIECMKGALDEEIAQRAVEDDRVIITNDKDFGRLAEFYKLPGLILLRLKDESVENKVKMVSFLIASYDESILGNVMVVSETKIRVRRIKKSS
jgi:predicted nuclease of predicted toxin-antitoxin system